MAGTVGIKLGLRDADEPPYFYRAELAGVNLTPHGAQRHLQLRGGIGEGEVGGGFERDGAGGDHRLAISSSTSAWHGWSNGHQQARFLPRRKAIIVGSVRSAPAMYSR